MNPRTFHRAVAIASLLATGCSWEWDRFAPGTTADAGTDLGTTADGPGMDSPDVVAACATDDECARASADRPVCDAVSGRCVGCSPDSDTCGAGRFCAAATLACAAGCVSDQACATSAGDGGAGDGGVVAGRCDPSTHACVQCLSDEHCPIGTRCADRACVPGCDAARGCPEGSACCAGGCVDTAADPAHCGACGAACAVPNGAPACAAGRCGVARCNDGFGDCDGNATSGCETNTRTSAAHCGACGTACAERPNATAACAEGACAYACAMGFGDCDGDPANGCEADLSRALSDCGRCGNACTFTGGVGACVGGLCTRTACATGRGDCDGNTANGCEIDLQGDPANCRACGAACSFARATSVCVSGGCAIGRCDAGFDNCDLGGQRLRGRHHHVARPLRRLRPELRLPPRGGDLHRGRVRARGLQRRGGQLRRLGDQRLRGRPDQRRRALRGLRRRVRREGQRGRHLCGGRVRVDVQHRIRQLRRQREQRLRDQHPHERDGVRGLRHGVRGAQRGRGVPRGRLRGGELPRGIRRL